MKPEHKTGIIMIVDDTPANLDVLAEILTGHGYRTLQFPRGAMALRMAAQNPPDLLLLDIMMPEMDGFEVCRRIKAEPATKDIPVIFLSALSETVDKVKAFSVGGVDYITKPFQDEEVLARVKTHISLHQMKRELEQHNHHLEELVREKVKEVTDSQLATMVAISNLSEYRDEDTGLHIERTRSFCKALAQELRKDPRYADLINDSYVDNIYHAAPLHDIGKIGIPDNILLKPGKLDPAEFEIMKTHVSIGTMTLQRVQEQYPNNAFINMGVDLAGTHHEKWNGKGYPKGLAGESIPLSGRIMALADVYDALRSRRPYKEPFSHEKAVEIIKEGAGQHFDPAVVAVFLAMESAFDAISRQYQNPAQTGGA